MREARAILAGADPLHALRGSKVRSFYRNIAEPLRPGPVTIDRHAVAILFGTDTPTFLRLHPKLLERAHVTDWRRRSTAEQHVNTGYSRTRCKPFVRLVQSTDPPPSRPSSADRNPLCEGLCGAIHCTLTSQRRPSRAAIPPSSSPSASPAYPHEPGYLSGDLWIVFRDDLKAVSRRHAAGRLLHFRGGDRQLRERQRRRPRGTVHTVVFTCTRTRALTSCAETWPDSRPLLRSGLHRPDHRITTLVRADGTY